MPSSRWVAIAAQRPPRSQLSTRFWREVARTLGIPGSAPADLAHEVESRHPEAWVGGDLARVQALALEDRSARARRRRRGRARRRVNWLPSGNRSGRVDLGPDCPRAPPDLAARRTCRPVLADVGCAARGVAGRPLRRPRRIAPPRRPLLRGRRHHLRPQGAAVDRSPSGSTGCCGPSPTRGSPPPPRSAWSPTGARV